jgi:hypothetical protein
MILILNINTNMITVILMVIVEWNTSVHVRQMSPMEASVYVVLTCLCLSTVRQCCEHERHEENVKGGSHDYLPLTSRIRKIETIRNQTRKLIQMGDNTHHHDHVATTPIPASFRPMKIRVKRPAKPMPVLVLLLTVLMIGNLLIERSCRE